MLATVLLVLGPHKHGDRQDLLHFCVIRGTIHAKHYCLLSKLAVLDNEQKSVCRYRHHCIC